MPAQPSPKSQLKQNKILISLISQLLIVPKKNFFFFFLLLTLWCRSHHWPTTQPSSPQLEALTSRYLILISILSLYFSKLNLVYVWITLKTANMCVCVFFFLGPVHCSRDPQVRISIIFSSKLDPTTLFTQLKIILLPYFQF